MNRKFKVLVTRCDIPDTALDLLRESCELEIWPEERVLPQSELLRRIVDKDGLFIHGTDKIDGETLAAGQNLKAIASMSAGYDHIDVAEARKRGIRMGITPAVLNDAVAELAIALLLSRTRRLFESHGHLVDGSWTSWTPWTWMNGFGLKDSVVGIIGLGGIGLEVAKRLQPFKLKKLLYTSRTAKLAAEDIGAIRTDLTNLLHESDIVIVTCALTEETKHLLSDKEFEAMKDSAILVNVSRGAVVDQDALVRALREKKIGGAALDVMTPEPLPTGHELLSFPNCCLTPHIGSAERTTRIEMAEMTAKNLLAGLEGREMIAEIK